MPDSPAFPFDVFLSHNTKDKPRVRRLAERLKAAGVRVWLDDWAIKAGDVIALKVDEGLEQSRVLLLCISPAALASGWVALERSTSIHRDPANAGRRFIPLLLGDCDLPDTLLRYKYVDFREESEASFAEVLANCQPETEIPLPVSQPEVQKETKTEKRTSAQMPERTDRIAVLERSLSGHSYGVTGVSFSADGKWMASSSRDQTIKIWDVATGGCLATLEADVSLGRGVEITPDSKRILSRSRDGAILLWEANPDWECIKLEGGSQSVAVAGLEDERAISFDRDRTFRIWDLVSRSCLKTIRIYEVGEAACIAVNKEGNRALLGHLDGNVSLFELEKGTCIANLKGHRERVNSIQIARDGRFAVSGSADMTIKVWNLEEKTCSATFEGHEASVESVAISPNNSLVASAGSMDRTVRLWELDLGVCVQVITDDLSRPVSVSFSPVSVAFSRDGSRLMMGMLRHAYNNYVYHLTDVRPTPLIESTYRYLNAKVVLLGEGTVGKTSLAHRLIEDRYVVQDRTHGMNVWRLDLPLPSDVTLEREALLWDLAGQEDFRLIHQIFLDETALALMLVNPQNPDPFVDVGAWLKALKTANNPEAKRDAARLLIFSQIDVGGIKLGNAKIDRFRKEHGFADWLPTSAKTGENCSDKKNKGKPSKLKQLIAGSIPWDKLPWTSTPRLLAELKNAVMVMRDESDIRLLRFSELAQRLEQALPSEQFGESDLRTAVTLLANHGLARPLKFGDLVLLRPDLINGYAGAVIRAARAHTDEIGSVLEANIYRPDFDFTGVERLKHRPDEELLLRALVQTFLDHSLCIAEETPHGRHLVFPSQYRREKDTPKNPDIFVSYTFSGEWQTVWTTLVVRLWYSQEFAHRELWRNAAEFASAKGHTLGLLIKKENDGAATISLYFDVDVPDELKVLFIEYVHRHLARYACEVARDRRYLCPDCNKPVTDLEEVRKRLAEKKDFIYCQGCDEKVPLIDFIEQRLKSDLVARTILAMDEKTTRELDTQALEQILIGHMMAIAGEANQIFRPVTMFDHGIDGEVEFKDNDGKVSGKRIYIQLKSGNSYLRTRKSDGSEVFDVTNGRHLEYWINQPVDVYLVIRQKDETSGQEVIRWMNVTRYLKDREDKKSRQIIFDGDKLDMEAVWKVRDAFFPQQGLTTKKK